MSAANENSDEDQQENTVEFEDQEAQLDDFVSKSEEMDNQEENIEKITPTKIVINKKEERSDASLRSSQRSVKNHPVSTVTMEEAQVLSIKSKELFDENKENKDLEVTPLQTKKSDIKKKLNVKSLERAEYVDPYLVRPKPSFIDNKESFKFLPIYKKLFLKVNCPDLHTKLSK